jgi:hypothetical protein
MELREALTQIAEIRRQMARACFAAIVRRRSHSRALALWRPRRPGGVDPMQDIGVYLSLWIGMAALSVAAVAVEMTVRMYLTQDRSHLEPTWLAVEQFLPAVIAGVLVTVCWCDNLRSGGPAARTVAGPVQPGHFASAGCCCGRFS